ncbi:tRNA1(Val) (adenine(37)-N6)-methyltransferase [Kosmotoga pacifica]|nr:methyltransferase domain-containing protein [Kosmotoga pacifica]
MRRFDSSPIMGLSFDQSLPEGRTNHATVILALYSFAPKNTKKILELGSGSGAVSIFLAYKYGCEVIGIEKSEALVKLAEKNAHMNGLDRQVRFLNCSVEDADRFLVPGTFDMVVSNPPHFLHGGRISPVASRNSWRRLEKKQAEGFIKTARKMLKNKGIFYFLLHPRDLIRWINILEIEGFGIHRLMPIYGNTKKQARLTLVSGRKNSSSELIIEPPLVLNEEEE